jgi:hypothetical protein
MPCFSFFTPPVSGSGTNSRMPFKHGAHFGLSQYGAMRRRRPAIIGWCSLTEPGAYVGRRAMKRALAEGHVI